VGVFLYDANENVLRGTFGTGPTGELVDTSWYSEPLYPVTQQILSDPKGFVFTPDFTAQFNVPPGDEMYGVKGYVMVAAWAGEKPIAMIAADNGITGRRMTEDQIEALRLFAGYVGFAIENARLYAARQRELAERERVETEIKHSRASRLALTENTYDAIWSVDRHFKFLTFNSGFVELYRQFYDKVLDPEAGLDERLPISEAAYWRNAYTRALSGERFVSEYSVTLQGQQRSFEYAFNPIEADGQITGVAVFSRDITERKRTEAELQERERFLTLLNDITRAALETPTLKQMLQTLADRSAELFHADNASITLWDAESEVTLPMASSAPELRDAFRTLRPEPRALTVTAAVLRAGHALAWTM
jgi:PAS domain S-box-containing protein